MAPLPASVQYGLSSESNKDNKERVFVKLTDSAQKVIQEFLNKKRNGSANPTIQFLPGNEGKITIPSLASGEATFKFSINSNAVMGDAQGSFECVTSGGARRLDSCGPLPRRMRIHANDDSYAAIRNRMTSAAAAEHSKCTRVIKPNQTDIGIRVNVRTAHASSFAEAIQLAERAERTQWLESPERQGRPELTASRPLHPLASRFQHSPASGPQHAPVSRPLHPTASRPQFTPVSRPQHSPVSRLQKLLEPYQL